MSKALEDDARELHDTLVEAARRRNANEKDIEDPAEFERFMGHIEELGKVAQGAARHGDEPQLVGRAMLFYAKCLAVATAPKGIVPEAKA